MSWASPHHVDVIDQAIPQTFVQGIHTHPHQSKLRCFYVLHTKGRVFGPAYSGVTVGSLRQAQWSAGFSPSVGIDVDARHSHTLIEASLDGIVRVRPAQQKMRRLGSGFST
jgi:hypothetical protein